MGKVRTQRIYHGLIVSFTLSFFLFSPLLAQEFSVEIDRYKKQLREDPNNIDAMMQLARYLSWSGRLDEAIESYKEILKRKPEHVEAEIGLATVYSWQKKYAESSRMFRKIIEKYPDNVEALVGLGRVYSWQGEYQKSIKVFTDALRFDAENRELLLGLGRVYSWSKRYTESEAVYKKLLDKDPKDIETLRGLANTYKWGEKYSKGIEIELKVLDIEPKNVDSMLSIGYMYGQLGAIKQSVHWYEKAGRLAPERADIQAHLGILYSHTAQVDSAANAFKKAISLQERDIQNYISLGRVYSWQNKMQDAEKLYKKALEINPQSAGAYSGLGQLYFYNGLWSKSIEYYKKSLKLDPFYVESLQGLKRVSLLKSPTYTTRYNLFVSNYKTTLNDEPLVKEYQHVFAHELGYRWGPINYIEARVQQTQYAQRDLATGFRDYLFDEKTVSLRFDKSLWKDKLGFSVRYDQELFDSVGEPQNFTLQGEQWFQFGYGLLRFETGPLFAIASFSREPHIKTIGNVLDVDILSTSGGSAGYDFTDTLSVIGNFFFQDFTKGTRDRRDWKGIVNWRLPFLREMELGYEFRHRDRPGVVTNSGTIRYTDRFIKDKFLIEGLYRLDSENHSENFGRTNKNIFQIFGSYPIIDWIHLNTDVTFQVQRGSDLDNFKVFRNYITFILDWDAVRGKYYQD